MAKNEHYRNFSNRESFNGVPCRSDEELVPAVLTKEMKVTLKPLGLNYDNVETWTFRHGKKVPVVFIPNKKGLMDGYMTFFNSEVERYLKHLDEVKQEVALWRPAFHFLPEKMYRWNTEASRRVSAS